KELHDFLLASVEPTWAPGTIRNWYNQLVGAKYDSTSAYQKKRGRKSKAEKTALQAKKEEEIRTRRLALQPFRTLPENLADLPQGCDKCGKKNSKGDTDWWIGYKLHFDVFDSGIPLSAILTSASVHDSQVAIPLMQMTAERVKVLYDLADAAYDAPEIKMVSCCMKPLRIKTPFS
ncbi:MAG: transposase, partial [Lentisphaeria bacterium]|nr:transposase [Lentisphaeria bacterium]